MQKMGIYLALSQMICIFAPSYIIFMSYTKEPVVIDNPSEKLLKAIEKLRKHKHAELEKLRNMKPEEFSRRVILA
jgi:hypothetical protein